MPTLDNETTRSDRIELRATPQEKALLARAAAMENLDMTNFVLRTAVPAARQIIERTERIMLSERDTLRVLALLENPPPASEKLVAAARAWVDNQSKLSD